MRFILSFDTLLERDRSPEELKQFKKEVAKVFHDHIRQNAWERREHELEELQAEDDGTPLWYDHLIGCHFRLRKYPYWITGEVTGVVPREPQKVFVRLICVGVDSERPIPHPPGQDP